MWTRRIVNTLFASLVAASCVLPESGGENLNPLVIAESRGGGGDSSINSASSAGMNVNGPGYRTTGGAGSGPSSIGGTLGTGGYCAPDASANTGGAGDCNCGTGGASSIDTCPYDIPDSGPCPTTYCAGTCEGKPLPLNPNVDIVPVDRNMLFARRVASVPKNGWFVVLGAITTTDNMVQPTGRFQLGLYSDVNNAPGELLGYTGMINAGPGSEGPLSKPVLINDNSKYWILILPDGTNQISLEKQDSSGLQYVLYAKKTGCLPLQACQLPTMQDYSSSFTPALSQLVPYLYARYVPPN